MKRAKIIVFISAVSLVGVIAASAYALTQTPRFFMFQLGRAIDSNNDEKVQTLIDADRISDDYVTSAIKLVKADLLTNAQSSGNGFAALGGVIAVNTIDNIADGMKVQVADRIRSQLSSILDRPHQPLTQYLLTQSIQSTGHDTATVTISKPYGMDWQSSIQTAEFEIERINGRWKVVGFSDRTIREEYQVLKAATASTSTEAPQTQQTQDQTPQEVGSTVQPEQQIADEAISEQQSTTAVAPVGGRIGVLTASSPTARINLRDEPNTNTKTKRYGLVGDRVTIQDTAPGSDGYTWYKVQFQESGAIGWVRADFITIH